MSSVQYGSTRRLALLNKAFDSRDYYASPTLVATCSALLDDLATQIEDERYFLDEFV
jgi:hypothetical protein